MNSYMRRIKIIDKALIGTHKTKSGDTMTFKKQEYGYGLHILIDFHDGEGEELFIYYTEEAQIRRFYKKYAA